MDELQDNLQQDQEVISTELLNGGTQPELTLPEAPTPVDRTGAIEASLQGIVEQFQQPSAAEDTQTSLQGQILQQIQELGTESARRQELEAEAGLVGQREELQSVIGELNVLQKEAAAIPLSIQEEFAGRGVTAGGVEPVQTSRLRQNAIKSLGLAAIGQTLQGNISLAESTIQRAIEAEFEPQRQRLSTLQQLYEFNREDLSRVDRRRTELMGIQLRERERLLNIQESQKENIYNMAMDAVQKGVPQNAVNTILNSTDRETAISRYSQLVGEQYRGEVAYQEALKELDIEQKIRNIQQSDLDQEYKTILIDGARLENEIALDELEARRVAREEIAEAVEAGELPPLGEEQVKIASTYRGEFEKLMKESGFLDTKTSYQKILAASKEPSAAGDLSLIFSYMKMLDPGSVVREGEFANAQNATGIPGKVRAAYNNALRGERLNETTRTDFVDQGKSIYEEVLESQIELEDRYEEFGRAAGLPTEYVIRRPRASVDAPDDILSLWNQATAEQKGQLILTHQISHGPVLSTTSTPQQ